MPTILFNWSSPSFYTAEVDDEESGVKNILSLPNIKFLGSDEGCGCGFRHALLEDNDWVRVMVNEEMIFDNSNHSNLVRFIVDNNENETKVEILACWNGDFNEQIKTVETIQVLDILDENFYFKELGLYTVLL